MAEHEVHVAMTNLLWPRSGLNRHMFFDYWSGAHTQISSRLPGIHQYFQHHLDPRAGGLFPGLASLVRVSSPHPGFYGDAEITFANVADLAAFAHSLAPLMADEQNVFDKTISYQSLNGNTATIKDRTLDDSPNGDLGAMEKYMLYVRRAGEDAEHFRAVIRDVVAPMLAGSPHISKVRHRLPEHYDNEAVTLSAPNVSNFEADEDQIHASLEIVFDSAIARRHYADSEMSDRLAQVLAQHCRDIFPTRVLRTYTVYNHGRITLAGLRTPQMAAQIMALGASNQMGPEVEQLLLAPHVQIPEAAAAN